jgi:hypothetical protein
MSKNFETEEDRQNELAVIRKIAKDNKIIKLDRSGLDYEIEGKAYIEIKCYNIKHDQYKWTIVSLIKLLKMQVASKTLPTYLFIQFTDKLRYINVEQIEGKIKVGGRKKRQGSANDQELLCHVDIKKFITFNT